MEKWPEFRPRNLLARLRAGGVDFVVVGGYAAIAQGSARITQDLDICFAEDAANLDSLGEALVGLKARLRGVPEDVPFIPDGDTLRRIELLTLDTLEGPIDLLRAPSGAPTYSVLRRDADRIVIEGIPVLVASLEHLMAMKRAAGRRKDLLDLEELQAIERLRRGGTPRRPS